MLSTHDGPAQLVLRRLSHHRGVCLQDVIMDRLNGLLGYQKFSDSIKRTIMSPAQFVKLNVCAFSKMLMFENP
jgi:hypothetical protein